MKPFKFNKGTWFSFPLRFRIGIRISVRIHSSSSAWFRTNLIASLFWSKLNPNAHVFSSLHLGQYSLCSCAARLCFRCSGKPGQQHQPQVRISKAELRLSQSECATYKAQPIRNGHVSCSANQNCLTYVAQTINRVCYVLGLKRSVTMIDDGVLYNRLSTCVVQTGTGLLSHVTASLFR